MQDIRLTSRRYAHQVIALANALMLIGIGVHYLADLGINLVAPLVIAYVFYLGSAFIFAIIWRKVASSNPDMLTTVYMATSGFRMLAALATLTCVYVAVGREQMVPYAIVFMLFYLVAVGHHSAFFARFNNK